MNFKPGDVVFRRGLSGPKFHFGIVAKCGNELTVIENQLGWGVREILFEVFAAGLEVHVYDVPNRIYCADESIELARSLKGQAYNPLSFHCEHFVTYVTTGKAESGQSALWALLAALFDAPTPVLKAMLDAKPPELPKVVKKPVKKAGAVAAKNGEASAMDEILAGYRHGAKLADALKTLQERQAKREAEKLAAFQRFVAGQKEARERAEAKRKEDFKQLLAKLAGKKPE